MCRAPTGRDLHVLGVARFFAGVYPNVPRVI